MRRPPPAGSAPETLPAGEAAAFLGVKPATLYAYVSRGLLGSVPAEDGRSRRYLRRDLERLRARRDRPDDPTLAPGIPGSAGALRWGEPVLESAITAIGDAGPRYRGRSAIDLAASGVPFEAVAELLWTGAEPAGTPIWHARGLGLRRSAIERLLPAGAHPLVALSIAVPVLATADPGRFDLRPEAIVPRARELVLRMAASLGLGREGAPIEAALETGSAAATIATVLDARGGADGRAALHRALVLSADHELNTSAFAARVAASAGADVYACVSAGLAAWSGPRHGAAADRIEALVTETRTPDRADAVIHDRQRRGEAVPGFGHPLYPRGDPRTPPLLEAALALAPRDRDVRTILALVHAMAARGGPPPTVDTGVVAVAAALDLPAGTAAGLFAVGRTAGWIAHILEQYASGFLLRPRARYIGL